jgi:uncharacterized protein YsxB (DUF464 family)
MIRIYAVEDTFDDEGGSTLIITGHGSDNSEGDLACARISAVWGTILLGFADLAQTYPREVSFQKIEKKPDEPIGTTSTIA